MCYTRTQHTQTHTHTHTQYIHTMYMRTRSTRHTYTHTKLHTLTHAQVLGDADKAKLDTQAVALKVSYEKAKVCAYQTYTRL